jgi:hypothetical protein
MDTNKINNPDEPLLEDMLYRPAHKPLDTADGIFSDGINKMLGGINTAESVFDESPLFRTAQELSTQGNPTIFDSHKAQNPNE